MEWTAVVLLVAVVLGGAVAVAGALHAPWLARTIRCAIVAGCGEEGRLVAVYGAESAAWVRAYAPGIVYEPNTLTLPVDYRRCRSHRCSDADMALGENVWQTASGGAATVFTRVIDRRASGGNLYVQYWLFYPDSTYFGPAHAAAKRMPRRLAETPVGTLTSGLAGHHKDDWESYQVRIQPDGRVSSRASAHHGYASYRRWPNLNELPARYGLPRNGAWTPVTGWTRVSRGSHAGHLVDRPASRERRTEAVGVTLVPIEGMRPDERTDDFAITPPWRKRVYEDPERTDT